MASMARTTVALLGAALLAGCSALGGGDRSTGAEAGWESLVDATRGLDHFQRSGGDADWRFVDGALQATRGGKTPSYLVTRKNYGNFSLRSEFWASDDANSGIFFRCIDASKIGDETCYEANIFDRRPDPTYATGAIVKVAPVAEPRPKAGGRWNTMEIRAHGPHLQVRLNGRTTVDVNDSKLGAAGPVALQWGSGVIRFRKVEIRPE